MQGPAIERFLEETAAARRVGDVLRAALAAISTDVPGAFVARRHGSGEFLVAAATGSCAGLDGRMIQPGAGRREPEDIEPGSALRGVFHVAEAGSGRSAICLATFHSDVHAEEPADLRALALALGSEVERIRARRAAAFARRELKRLRGRNGFLIRGVSHDLKNPIGAIDGYVQLLDAGVRGELTDGQREWTGRIGRALQSMLALINDLLDMARVDSSAVTFEKQPLPLAAIVREAMQSLQAKAEESGIRIELDIPAEMPPALADLSRARQAMDKVLGFAMRVTPEGEAVRCSMSAQRADGAAPAVAFRVGFANCPTDPAEQVKLLEGLVKTEAAGGREPGTGLELALARRLARAMDGDLAFSGDGESAELVLQFPAASQR